MTRESTYPEIMTVSELQMFLRCSEKTALSLLKDGSFPNAFRIGKRWRIPKTDVVAWTHKQK